MKVGIAIALSVLFFLVGAVVLRAEFDAVAQEPPLISVIDAMTGLSTIDLGSPYVPIPSGGFAFTVNVTLNVTSPIANFMAFQIALKYNATFVNCTGAWMNKNDCSFVFYALTSIPGGPLIKTPSSYALWGATLISPESLPEGQYLLGQANFTAFKSGSSLLEFMPYNPFDPTDYSFLLGSSGEDIYEIPSAFENCQVNAASAAAPPVALFTFNPLDPKPLKNVTFDASASFDPAGEITWYMWDFGDFTAEKNTTESIVWHVYALSGMYNVTLTVTDDSDLSSSVTHTLEVEDVIPEYPSILTLPLIMIATLSAVILQKRNGKKK